jgi:AraC-like DNA-binding protein
VEANRGKPDGLVTTTQVGSLNLVFVRYGARVTVDAFPTHNRFTLTVPLGPMLVSHTGQRRAAALQAGFVLSQDQHTLMQPDPMAGALVVSTSMARIEEHLAGLTGRASARALRFLPPAEGQTVAPGELLESSWRLVCQTISGAGVAPPSPLLARRLEDVLLSGILLALPHTGMADLIHEDERATRGMADRARLWLEDHSDEDITVTDLSRAMGVSVRRLQYLFGDRFGVTPTAMLRDIRLVRAHRLLADSSSPAPTVADVAYRCGFGHLSRFAIAYRERFGESPSATLSRVHGRR